jgi:alanine racemase
MRAAWLEVDLDAYRANVRALAEYAGTPVLAVVKANGYGHGIALIARAAVEAGCPGVAVALPEEGAELRAGGQPGRIVVLGLSLEEQADLLAEHELEPVVTRPQMLTVLSEAGRRRGEPVPVHVKVDTGMTRVGVEPEEALAFCGRTADDPHLRLAGVVTHFASAEDEDLSGVEAQWSRFEPLVAALRDFSAPPVLHAANSAAGLWFPPARLDWIRGGLLTYGVPPAPRPLPFAVRPVASLKAKVVQVREVPAGRQVSYGGTWTTHRPSRLALVTVGYADGLPWALSNQGAALVHGRRAPIRGRVCMDQVVLDVTDHPPVAPGDEAVFIGRQGAEEITVGEIAALAGTITYEVLTRLSARLPRVPVEGGAA